MTLIFRHVSALSLLLCSIALQPISARPSFAQFATSTQETISEHKNTMLALGAAALIGLGIYYWKTNATTKPTSSNSAEPTIDPNAQYHDMPLLEPDVPMLQGYKDDSNGQSQDSESEPLNTSQESIDAEESDYSPHDKLPFLPTINKQKIESYLTGPLHGHCITNQQDAFAHIHRGYNVVQQILAGDLVMDTAPFDLATTHADRHTHLYNIVSACWYLYGVAASKDQAFDEGSFVVHDNGALYDYLLQYVKNVNPDAWQSCVSQSSNPYGYCRHSTHIKEFQKQGNHHYGIDIRFGDSLNWWEYWVPYEKQQQAMLPAGNCHILFGRMDDNRTFIKMEHDGLYLYDGWRSHATGAIGSVARKFGFGSNDLPTYRKEHMPAEIQREIKQLMTQHNLGYAIPTTISGIIAASHEHPALTNLANKLRKRFDTIESRLGNEVILTRPELATRLA